MAIAELYNQQRPTQLTSPGAPATPESMEKAMLACVKAARSYLFPNVTSINRPKPGYDSGEIVDSLPGEIDDSLLTEMIVGEEVEQRTQQQTDINQFLTATIASLGKEEQKLLQLYYAQDLKQAEIAKHSSSHPHAT